MKRLLLTAALFLLAAPALAAPQSDQQPNQPQAAPQHGGDHGAVGQPGGHPDRNPDHAGPPRMITPPAHPSGGQTPPPSNGSGRGGQSGGYQNGGNHNDINRGNASNGVDPRDRDGRADHAGNNNNRPGVDPRDRDGRADHAGNNNRPGVDPRDRDGRADHAGNNGNRNDWNRHDRYSNDHRDWSNVRNYHRNFNAPHRYRGPRYQQPRGYYYRRWSWGDILPSLFWSDDSYWMNDYDNYDLPAPPPGTVWVRYGNDALLIDRYTGEILETEYDIFY